MHEAIYVTKPSLPPREEFDREIDKIYNSCWLTNVGNEHKELENNLKSYLNVKNLSLFANGHLALEAALQSYDFPTGSEVITTPFTFTSTTYAITHSGLTPVFCDVKADDCTIDADLIESHITEKTVAIVPVHVYGYLCDTDKIEKIAKKHKLAVIYDAAHAFGVTRKSDNRPSGSFGDVSMFSFHATKVFNTFEGGALTYNDSALYDLFSEIKDFGILNAKNIRFGFNAKMTEDHAAMGICNLRHVDEYIAKRRKWSQLYDEKLAGCKGIRLIKPSVAIKSNYAYYPVEIIADEFGCSRDELVSKLKEYNIFPRKYFYPLTSQLPAYDGKYQKDDTPVAARLSENILTLPLYSELGEENVSYICNAINEIKRDNCKVFGAKIQCASKL